MAAPEILAAAVPMAANQFIVTEEQEQHLAETKIPVMFLTSTRGYGHAVRQREQYRGAVPCWK